MLSGVDMRSDAARNDEGKLGTASSYDYKWLYGNLDSSIMVDSWKIAGDGDVM